MRRPSNVAVAAVLAAILVTTNGPMASPGAGHVQAGSAGGTAASSLAVVAGVNAIRAGAGIAAGEPGADTPVASNDALYAVCGRVFSDPHAYWPSPSQAATRSPYAKGNAACAATDFLQYQEMIDGLAYLEALFPTFVEVYVLEDEFGDGSDCATSTSNQDLCSAGLPRQGVPPGRVKSDLYMVRVTDERVPEAQKKYFAFPLSIHGIERAGAEAGVRVAEDLAAWGYCEAVASGRLPANGKTDCALEGEIPHPLLEAQESQSLTAGNALRRSSVYLIFSNPDGWRRGDRDNLVRYFQRYNGNGVDLNRDWPTVGYTFRPYTPFSEPETRGFGRTLKKIRQKWDGGIDLHGQLIDRAFSFTLLGAGQHDYSKNQRILQTVKGAWRDAEARLAWSPLIKPNTAPDQCSGGGEPPGCDERMYGVQWGTVWDTIDYTVTGGFGDWINSPIGLDGDGIDNEMSLSHLSNCGIGSCYLVDAEQLHVDGNKSLVYSMVNFSLRPEDTVFRVPGKVAYVFDPTVVSDPGDPRPAPISTLGPQPAIMDVVLSPANDWTHEFEVKGEADGFYNGGLEGKVTATTVGGIGPNDVASIVLERHEVAEPPIAEDGGCGAPNDEWGEINRYFNQGPGYAAAGQAVHANDPLPGEYRICFVNDGTAALAGAADLDITFSGPRAQASLHQRAYSVSNMRFFADLATHMAPGQLTKLTTGQILSMGNPSLDQYDSLVLADDPFPMASPTPAQQAAWATKLKGYARRGGNLVLTDRALRALGDLGLLPADQVERDEVYAGFIAFTADDGATDTYDDPLARRIDQPGAAEGSGHRHQTYEPVPIGFAIQNANGGDADHAPVWTVDQATWQAAGGRTAGTIGEGRVGLGELPVGRGRVRVIGALLPMPTEAFDHQFGLANYAVTYSGYQLLNNALQVAVAGTGSRGAGR